MNRFSALLLAALLALLTLGAAAPTWPPADLTYFNGASAQVYDLHTFAQDGIAAFGKQDAKALATAIEDAQAVATYFAEEQAPPAMAPLAIAGQYAGSVCVSTLTYFSQLKGEAATSPFAVPTLLAMRSDCADAIQSAKMEVARAVAAAGSYPPAK
jgi:hypothetical protein